MYVITLVSPVQHPSFDDGLRKYIQPVVVFDRIVKEKDRAVQWFVEDKPLPDFFSSVRSQAVDIFIQAINTRSKKLFLADMDSTIVKGETLDDMAAKVGIGEKVSEITDKAMRGEIDFEGALRERVALIKDLPLTTVEEMVAAVELNPGAETLLKGLKAHGIKTCLVSGGFTPFTAAVAEKLGFDENHGNTLGVDGDKLDGTVVPPILDKSYKLKLLDEKIDELNISYANAIAIGDGANDLPMLQNASLGIGYRPKPILADMLPNLLIHNDLDALLYCL